MSGVQTGTGPASAVRDRAVQVWAQHFMGRVFEVPITTFGTRDENRHIIGLKQIISKHLIGTEIRKLYMNEFYTAYMWVRISHSVLFTL